MRQFSSGKQFKSTNDLLPARSVQKFLISDKLSPNAMGWFHLILGLIVFVVFVTTGKYMRIDFPDKDAISPELRILMRSRHIYILFSALIHLSLGVYVQLRPELRRRLIQFAGSAVLTYSSVLLIWAFVVESYSLQHFSNLSRTGIYAALTGIGIHILGGLNLPEWLRRK
jgi:hypothetical protein